MSIGGGGTEGAGPGGVVGVTVAGALARAGQWQGLALERSGIGFVA